MENQGNIPGNTNTVTTSLSDWSATSETIGKITEALSKAQGAMPHLVKDKMVSVEGRANYSYAYLTLPEVLGAIKKPMSDHGLALTFGTARIASYSVVVGTLSHISGEWIRVTCPFFLSDTKMQSLGSAKTYARRYIVQDLFNIAGDEDDDGNLADGNKATITPRQITKASEPKQVPNYAPSNRPPVPR